MVPFVHETSYVKFQVPVADRGDQDKAIVGGAPLTRKTSATGPLGQAVQHNETGLQSHVSRG